MSQALDQAPALEAVRVARAAPTALVLSDAQAATMMGCSRSHWRSMDRLGQVPASVKLGRSTKWRRDEVIDWLNAGCPPRHQWRWRPKAARSA